jgi:hypothetical protein
MYGVPEQYNFGDAGPFKKGVSFTYMFPAIQGAQKVSVIVTIGAGETIEKEADPKLFALR